MCSVLFWLSCQYLPSAWLERVVWRSLTQAEECLWFSLFSVLFHCFMMCYHECLKCSPLALTHALGWWHHCCTAQSKVMFTHLMIVWSGIAPSININDIVYISLAISVKQSGQNTFLSPQLILVTLFSSQFYLITLQGSVCTHIRWSR